MTPATPQYSPRMAIKAIMPATVTLAIHHMLAMKKRVPLTQLQKNAERWERVW